MVTNEASLVLSILSVNLPHVPFTIKFVGKFSLANVAGPRIAFDV